MSNAHVKRTRGSLASQGEESSSPYNTADEDTGGRKLTDASKLRVNVMQLRTSSVVLNEDSETASVRGADNDSVK